MEGVDNVTYEDEGLREMKTLVSNALEYSGKLGSLRAQVRASVFHALQDSNHAPPMGNASLRALAATPDGALLLDLVDELLQSQSMVHTQGVFRSEASLNATTSRARDRTSLAREVGIFDNNIADNEPLLLQVIRRQKNGGRGSAKVNNDGSGSNTGGGGGGGRPLFDKTGARVSLAPEAVKEAVAAFSRFDTDASGDISKNELRSLLASLFPDLNGFILERYVTEEFQAADTDFSARLDFVEFLGIYKRLVYKWPAAGSASAPSALVPKMASSTTPAPTATATVTSGTLATAAAPATATATATRATVPVPAAAATALAVASGGGGATPAAPASVGGIAPLSPVGAPTVAAGASSGASTTTSTAFSTTSPSTPLPPLSPDTARAAVGTSFSPALTGDSADTVRPQRGTFLTQPSKSPPSPSLAPSPSPAAAAKSEEEREDAARLEEIETRLRELRSAAGEVASLTESVGAEEEAASQSNSNYAAAHIEDEYFEEPFFSGSGSATLSESLSEVVSELASEHTLSGNYTSDYSIMTEDSLRDFDLVEDARTST